MSETSSPTSPTGPTGPTGAGPTGTRTSAARHPLSIGHLVMGVAFAGLTVVWALVASDVVDGRDVRFLLPVPWVLAGAAGLLALVVSDRRKHGSRATGWIGLEEPRPADHPDDDPARRGSMEG